MSSCELSGCKPVQTSSGRYRIREVYHLQMRGKERTRRRKLVNQSTSSSGQIFPQRPLKPIKHKRTQRKQTSNSPSNIHSSSGGIIILHHKNSLPALIQQIKPYEVFPLERWTERKKCFNYYLLSRELSTLRSKYCSFFSFPFESLLGGFVAARFYV